MNVARPLMASAPRLISALGGLLLGSSLLVGQISSGSFYGSIEDPSGGLLAGARIEVRQDKTGFVRKTSTNTTGLYRLPDLAPGIYSVTVERVGFRTSIAPHISLEINQEARIDFRLQIGAAHETVTVAASASPLQTADSSEGYRFDSATFTQLPIDGRNVLSLVTVGPGAIPRQLGGFGHDIDNDAQQGSRGSVALNPPINGARPSMNTYLLDGAYNTDRNTFSTVVIPPMDAVEEFRIQSSLAAPAFSQAGGGVVDIATKSGGHDFHGSAFEFLRNEATDARNFFDDPTLARPIFRRNQFGGSLGGPLPLPSTFFFVAYEGLRSKSAKSSVQLVPDATERSGDFTGDSTIYDPLTPLGRAPFAGNKVPAVRFDPIASKYLSQFEPLPNRSAGSSASNYLDSTPSTSDHDSISGRVDHQFRDAGLLFGRYTINDESGDLAGSFPLRPTSESLRAQQITIGHTFARANWINDIRTSFTRLRLYDVPLSAFTDNTAAALGIANPPTDPFAFGLPYFLLTNFSTVTDDPTLPQTQRDNTWNLADSLSIVRGRHTWKLGVDWTRFQLNYQQSNLIRGRYTYTGAFTASATDSTSGNALADFLLGFPQKTERTIGSPLAYLRQSNYGLFIQHDWQVTNRLTINTGLRYDYNAPFSETRNKLLNLDYSGTVPALTPVNTASNARGLNFSPRFGLAWRLPSETVFRAAYGVYFNPEIAVEAYDLVLNGVQSQVNTTDGSAAPVLTTRNGFAATSATGFPSYFGLDRNAPTPYIQQWNAGFEKELPTGVLFEVSYVGSKGTHLGLFRRFNVPLQLQPGDLQSLRPFPELGTLFQRQHIGNSSYHSLQLKAERHLKTSLTFLASYVWSKSIDDADTISAGQFESAGAQNESNLRLEKGLSFSNVPRRVSAGFVYNLPKMLRNWQFSGLITLQDGTPLNPFYFAADIANSGTPNRPNVVPGQSISLPSSQRSVDRWFNTAAFSDPAPNTFGNAGRNIIPGPGNEVVDIALHRRFVIRERATLEIRAESFNLLNHPNYGIPGPYPDFGPFFGKILSTGDPRRLEFGTRFDF
jgi:outer membrane receptor protein involved in Fe transport